jgi:hypothetical protein
LQNDQKYANLLQWGRDRGQNLDKIEYPAAFGPYGELLGFACACDIAAGETILQVPYKMRIDVCTIMASEIGPVIKAVLPPEDASD